MSISGETTERSTKTGQPDVVPFTPNRPRTDAFWRLGAGVVALIFLRLYPFSSDPGFSVCGFHWLTGHPCPLCGMTRALSCLTKSDWTSAVHFNLLSPLVFGILLATIGSAAVQFFAPEFSWLADLGFRRDKWWTTCLALFAVYGVLRISYLVP